MHKNPYKVGKLIKQITVTAFLLFIVYSEANCSSPTTASPWKSNWLLPKQDAQTLF